jgi:molybdopterin molybdotransferase
VTSSALGWQQARHRAHRVTALPARVVALPAANGCVLAEDLPAQCDLPPWDTSAMDGWAVSGPPPWSVVGQSLAGRAADPPGELRPTEAVVIATGAIVPAGATGIVRSERGALVESGDSPRPVLRTSDPGRPPDLSDVRPRGHEARAGELLVRAGVVVRPTTVGLAAAAGYDGLLVHPRPQVSILVLGDELLDAGPPRAGAVRDALGVQLPAWVDALGGRPDAVLRVPDDPDTTLAAVRAALARADVVVTTGGSAGGAADHLRGALAALDARLVVDTVDVRPGHPMLLAALPEGRWLVGLPGNPLAALAGVVTLLQPLLAGLSAAPLPSVASAPVEEAVPVLSRGRRPRGHLLIPVAAGSAGRVRPTGYAASAMLRGVASADGFLLVPAEGIEAGAEGTVIWFPWALPSR